VARVYLMWPGLPLEPRVVELIAEHAQRVVYLSADVPDLADARARAPACRTAAAPSHRRGRALALAAAAGDRAPVRPSPRRRRRKLTAQTQVDKLRLVSEVARSVWG
jgi:hypothetical protein